MDPVYAPEDMMLFPRVWDASNDQGHADFYRTWLGLQQGEKPGFGDNMRVLKWMLDRLAGTAQGEENIFGTTPRYEDLSWEGLELSLEQFSMLTSIDKEAWRAELALHNELFDKLKHNLPQQLVETMTKLEQRLSA